MGQSTAIRFGEKELAALNARAEVLSQREADDWEEAVDWGTPDCSSLSASESHTTTSPEFD